MGGVNKPEKKRVNLESEMVNSECMQHSKWLVSPRGYKGKELKGLRACHLREFENNGSSSQKGGNV